MSVPLIQTLLFNDPNNYYMVGLLLQLANDVSNFQGKNKIKTLTNGLIAHDGLLSGGILDRTAAQYKSHNMYSELYSY